MEIGKVNISDFWVNLFGSDRIKQFINDNKTIFDETGDGNGNGSSEIDVVLVEKELSALQEKLESKDNKTKSNRQAINDAIKQRKQNQRERIIKDEVAQFMNNTGLPSDVAAELVALTLKSAESLEMVDRNTISQMIKTFAEQNHINKDELVKIQALKNTVDGFTLEDIQEEREQINSEYKAKMEENAIKLSSATKSENIVKIQEEMNALQLENHSMNMKLAQNQYMLETELPPNIASELFNLTVKKYETPDINESESFNNSIQNMVKEFNIGKEELSKLNPVKSELKDFQLQNIESKRFSIEVAFQQQVGELQNILFNISNEHERSLINSQIIELNRIHEQEVRALNKEKEQVEYKSLDKNKEKAEFIKQQQINEKREKYDQKMLKQKRNN